MYVATPVLKAAVRGQLK